MCIILEQLKRIIFLNTYLHILTGEPIADIRLGKHIKETYLLTMLKETRVGENKPVSLQTKDY